MYTYGKHFVHYLFAEAGVDEEIFRDELDESMLNKLFNESECGYQRKFIKRMEEWKNVNLIDTSLQKIDSVTSRNSVPCVELTDPPSVILDAPIEIIAEVTNVDSQNNTGTHIIHYV